MAEVLERKRKGGKMTPYPPEMLETVKTAYLAGTPWKEIAQLTGIHDEVLRRIASNHKWTTVKAEQKAKAELDGLRPLLHNKLSQAVTQVKIPKSTSAKRLQPVADFIHTATQSAEKLEGWAPTQGNTLINVALLTECVTVEALPREALQGDVLPDASQSEAPVIDLPSDPAG